MININEVVNTIINGDSLEVMKDFPDESVNLIITSPPYFGCRTYGDEMLGRELHPLEYIENLFQFTKEFKRILRKDGSLYLNIGDTYFGPKGFHKGLKKHQQRKTHKHYENHVLAKEDGKYLQTKQLLMVPPRLAIKMQDDGWILRNQNLWFKPNAVPSFSKDRRLPVYEYFYHFVKTKKYYFDYDLAKSLGHHRDIIECTTEPFGEHQATFPAKLISPFIQTTSKEGDIVLDPFGGAGTVGVVCQRINRKFILIELHKEYCEKTEKRLGEGLMDWLK